MSDRGTPKLMPFEDKFHGMHKENSVCEDAVDEGCSQPEQEDLTPSNLGALESPTEARFTHTAGYVTKSEAVHDLVVNIWRVPKPVPTRPERVDVCFSDKWLDCAILYFKDSCSHVQAKIIANCYGDVKNLQDLLNAIWKFGIPFNLYIPEADASLFADWTASPWDELAQWSMYELDFSKWFMTKINGSARTQFGIWVASAMEVVKHPLGVGFIYEGGIYSELAQSLDPTLVERWSWGPSLQVMLFSKVLLGYTPGATSDQDRTLFPSPEILEEGSDHFWGMTGASALVLIEGLLKKAQNNPKWQTEAQWRSYLRPNKFGERVPTHIPGDEDFDAVAMKLRRAFPINWQLLRNVK
ncbi:hypothetical protein K438DRAFT_1969274 [Mycena galopus ATCC 62051]|nr:hypothetical protein K438DRAFT_1969274 [Mycena galopus ATCC 62051]